MAIVYEVRHGVLPRRAALKVIRSHAPNEDTGRRLLREACVLSELRHRAIVDVLDAGTLDDGRMWLAMNLVDGPTLAERLLVRSRLAADEVIELAGPIADALAAAHTAGVVHRDLKPENIILVDDPGCPVRLIDWGIAQAGEETSERLTVEGSILGTPHYMAPEQVRGERVDGRCDVYALGILVYEMLTGAPPFTGAALEVVAHHLVTAPPPLGPRAPAAPTWLVALVGTMLSKHPDGRPTSAEVAAMMGGVGSRLGAAAPEDVIEMIAAPAEDELDREMDRLIAELPPRAAKVRLAIGSSS